MTKRILVVTHAGGSPHHGPNMRWYYLGQALRPLGVEVEIVSSTSFHKYIHPPNTTERLETELIDGLSYHWIKTRTYRGRGYAQVLNQLDFVLGCWRSHEALASREPDVVVASSPHPFVVYPAKRVAARAGAKFVYEVRDLWPELLVELGGFSRWHPYMVLLGMAEKHGVKNADLIVSVKPGDGDYFKSRYGLPDSAFAYVPNGALQQDTDAEIPSAFADMRKRYAFIVGYTGALSAYYGLDELLKLACRFRHRSDVGFVVVGKGDQQEELRRVAQKMGLLNFHLMGAVEKSKVGAILKTFDACYVGLEDLAIHKYGISCNKIYDYMLGAKPIIGSYRAEYDPVIAAGCGYVACRGHVDVLESALLEMIDDPRLAVRLGEKGRAYFLKHHDFSAIAVQLKELLFTITEEGRL